MHQRENVSNYFEKFDSMVRVYETMEGAPSILENKIRSTSHNGVIDAITEIEQAHLLYNMQNEVEIPMEKLRMYMLHVKASRREYQALNNQGQNVQPRVTPAWGPLDIPRAQVDAELRAAQIYEHRNMQCHRCYYYGHIKPRWPLIKRGPWFFLPA